MRNIVAWFLYISPDLFQDLANMQKHTWTYILNDITGRTCFFMFFVFHSRILYEKLFINKRYTIYFLSLLTTIFIWREGTSYLMWLATKPAAEHVYHIVELQKFNWVFWVFIYWADLIYIGIALGVYLAFKYFKERAILLEMDNVRKELELKQLNEQLNPHFLFNALNNIYSHLLNDSNDGKELVLKLGELMRYILDSSKKSIVSLNDELNFIEHYIAFEKERQGSRCTINYTKNITATDFKIVPLIFFNFIENAFKHGTTSIRHSEININIEANNEVLRLIITNPVYNSVAYSTQTGMNNAQRRLTLLYPGANTLNIDSRETKYTAMLELKNMQ